MNLSIIIVSWNTRDILAQCLSSIYLYPPEGTFEIWVIDNASDDSSIEMLKSDFPDVRLIENTRNVGFAHANNQALQICSGENVMLLNPDTEVFSGTFKLLADFLQTHSNVGVVGPKTLNPDQSLQTSCYPFPTLLREFWRLLHFDKLKAYGTYSMQAWDTINVREVDVLLGACLLIPKAVLDETGFFDENYFMYTEEVDLCYRIQKSGKHNYWLPQASIIHYGGQSTKQAATAMFLQLYKSKLQFFRKHYGRIVGFLYKLILFLTALPRLLSIFLVWKRPQSKIFANYWRLIKALPNM